jgi:SAM-dependent methyltransferase
VSPSLLYRSPAAYELVMRALYRGAYRHRLSMVAAFVPAGATVLELCPGPGELYRRHLHARAGRYTAIDVNQGFLERLRRHGAEVIRRDLSTDAAPLPICDVAIMQASLYHFLPAAADMVERMLAAARARVIVAEPIRNLSSSRLAPVAWLGRRAADPGTGEGHAHRFDEAALDRLMARYARRTVAAIVIPGGREKIYVLDPAAA